MNSVDATLHKHHGGKMIPGMLDGVKVLDLSEDIAGSFCTRLLADYGADVLKVEPPSGAQLRRMGPFFQDDPNPEKSLFYLPLNLNKKGITLNLETTAGQNILKRLSLHVDIIVESYEPGYMKSLGLSYDELSKDKPGLIMTSITPFGQDGPYASYKGGEIVEYAMSMVMSISGLADREPLKHGGFQAQYQGGLFAAAATSIGLYGQSNNGVGEHIDVSIVECLASTMMATQTIYPFVGATQARRQSVGDAFSNPMPCEDGWIIVQAGGGATWEDISDFFQEPKLLEPRFSEPAQRANNGAEMDEIIINSIKSRGKWELFTKAADARMLFGLVQPPSELIDCPQLESREFFREIQHPTIGNIKVPAELFKVSETPYQLHSAAPTLGQNNHEIYVEGLGYSTSEYSQLRQLNII